jgi:hypothetical protein
MAKYRLLADHVMADQVVPEGTEVGDGTAYPLVSMVQLLDGTVRSTPYGPSLSMEPLDDEAKAVLAKRMEGVGLIPPEILQQPTGLPKGMPVPGQGPRANVAPDPTGLPGQGPRDRAGQGPSARRGV